MPCKAARPCACSDREGGPADATCSRCFDRAARSSSQAVAPATSHSRERCASRSRSTRVARSRFDERLRLREPRPQPDGPARAAERDLEPEAATAESWELRDGRKTVTFHLREDGRWTNGDAVTAADFEYAWKRILDPKLAADYAYQLYGIVGAAEYNGCEKNCAKLRDQVGIKALDERTLEVKLTSPQPWFVSQVAHVSFLPVHRATVERFGRNWTEPGNIVTNGPYRLTDWKHDESITLTKWHAVASCRRRPRRADRGADHQERDDRAGRVRGGRDRCVPRTGLHSHGRHRTAPGERRVPPVTQSPDPVPRPEPEDDPGPEPAACARVRARPHLDRRKRDQGRRRARHQLHAERDPGLRRDQAGLPADPRRPRRCPDVSGPSADSEANAQLLLPQRQRPGRAGDRGSGAGDVEADRHRDEAQGTGKRGVLRIGSARRSTPLSTSSCSGGSATTSTTSISSRASRAVRQQPDRLLRSRLRPPDRAGTLDAGRRRPPSDLRPGRSDADRPERSTADHSDTLGDFPDDAQVTASRAGARTCSASTTSRR